MDVPVIIAGILGIGLTVGRWYRPRGRLSPDEIADEYIRFVLKALDARVPAPAIPDRRASSPGQGWPSRNRQTLESRRIFGAG